MTTAQLDKPERLLWLDAVKALYVLLVVHAHSDLLNVLPTDSGWPKLMFYFGTVFSVPGFYFIAGFFMLRSLYYGNGLQRSRRKYIGHRFMQLIIPGIIFMILAFPYSAPMLLKLNFGCNYFTFCLFASSCIILTLTASFRHPSRRLYRLFVLLAIAVLANIILSKFAYLRIDRFSFYVMMYALIWVSLGCFFAEFPNHNWKRYANVYLVILAWGGLIFLTLYMESLSLQPALLSILKRLVLPALSLYCFVTTFYLIRRIFQYKPLAKVIDYLSHRTLALYVMSWVVIAHVDYEGWFGLSMNNELSHFATSTIVILLTLAMHDALCLIPGFGRYIMGYKAKSPAKSRP